VVDLEADEAADRLNEAGSLGWELVAALPTAEGGTRAYLKREVWTSVSDDGSATAFAPRLTSSPGAAAAGGGGGFFAAGYLESGPDLDGDGDVDGGLFDSLGDLFG